jgi:hypothetical protein
LTTGGSLGYNTKAAYTAHSSSGLGRRPLKAEITGSNPVCATTTLSVNASGQVIPGPNSFWLRLLRALDWNPDWNCQRPSIGQLICAPAMQGVGHSRHSPTSACAGKSVCPIAICFYLRSITPPGCLSGKSARRCSEAAEVRQVSLLSKDIRGCTKVRTEQRSRGAGEADGVLLAGSFPFSPACARIFPGEAPSSVPG